MIRVLVLIGSLDLGGAEGHLVQVLPRLAERGFDVELAVLTHRGTLAEAVEAGGVRVLAPPLMEPVRRFSGWLPRWLRDVLGVAIAVPWLGLVVARSRPDVIHFFLPTAYVLGGLCSWWAPIGLRVMSRRSLNVYQRHHPLLTRLEHLLHRRMDAVLGNSSAVVKELIAEGVPSERVGLLYNGIDLERFGDRARRAELRRGLELAPDTLVLIMVANLIAYKGHADLLQALALASPRLPAGWALWLVGRDDGIGRSLEQQAARLGLAERVRLLGARTDVADLLAAADLGVLCSHQEGFSNSLLEGMASGLPMVATRVGGNTDAVVDGESGRLVAVGEVEALAAALVELGNDPGLRRRFGQQGRARVEKHFALPGCIDRYERLYRTGQVKGLSLDPLQTPCNAPACAE